ncbi:unnamed protein product [Phytophthora fragariaefolia]|uniref:Unnamed protein product n=1 Tax=Phytophthora fragariaefolia TaxID=1490495 RepID=A0A9W6YJZ3_9STRA|nr:unnamed protein product [Phytophthora fragariaefolia]
MKINTFIVAFAAICFAATDAQKTKESGTPAPTPLATMPEELLEGVTQQDDPATVAPAKQKEVSTAMATTPTINYEMVKPYEEPEPHTITERAAIKFKPQLHIASGCHSYPAVNELGQVSTWLKEADTTGASVRDPNWEHVIVWTNNPNVTDPVILAVTTSKSSGSYATQIPANPTMVNGTSVKVSRNDKELASSIQDGESQDLVMWHQLSAEAQEALNNDQSFSSVQVPVNDNFFLLALGKAWPFDYKPRTTSASRHGCMLVMAACSSWLHFFV